MAQRTHIMHGTWVEGEAGGQFVFWAEFDDGPNRRWPADDIYFPIYTFAEGSDPLIHGDSKDISFNYRYRRNYYLEAFLNWGLQRIKRLGFDDDFFPPLAQRYWLAAPNPRTEQVVGWRIVGMGLDVAQAISVLGRVAQIAPPRRSSSQADHALLPYFDREDYWSSRAKVGADLLYWATVSRFVVELLARGSYRPALATAGQHWQAGWEAAFDQAGDAQRLAQLAAAMPPACRALTDTEQRLETMLEGQTVTSMALLHSFINAAIDAEVRRIAQNPTLRPTDLDESTRNWLKALFAPKPVVQDSLFTIRPLLLKYREWQGHPAAAGDFLIAIRIEPPGEAIAADDLTPHEEEDELQSVPKPAPAPSDDEHWRLRLLLQAKDDPSLLVPAALAWEPDGAARLGNRFRGAKQQTLLALGRIANIFPPAASVQAANPTVITLDLAEAYSFLSNAAPLLELEGFVVIVPGWWLKRPRLSASLTLNAPDPYRHSSGFFEVGDLISYDWQVALGGEKVDAAEFERLAQMKQPLVRVRGRWVELRADQTEAALDLLRRKGNQRVGLGEAVRLAMGGADFGADIEVTQVQTQGWLQTLMSQLAESHMEQLPPPASFVGTLRPYQVNGYSWLAFLRRYGLGACLADDMGLGKTIQVLALLAAEQEQGVGGCNLLICPTSVVGNWQREAARFTPNLKVMVHHGAERQKGEEFANAAKQHDLVVSSYSLLYRDEELLSQVQWRSVILDEAQNIKNHNTRQSRAAKRLPGQHRIALTGTPVENRLAELWSIMDFLNHGYLGGYEQFNERYAQLIERQQSEFATTRLRKLVAPFIMRRVKTDPRVIQDLPDKNEMKVYCNLTLEQATLYEAFVRNILKQIEESNGMARRGLILKMLTRLKQICNHPAQFLGDNSRLEGRSGKLARLGEMLEEAISEGDQALVFTQFATMGAMLQTYLQERCGDVLYLYGGTPREEREQMVNKFQAGGAPIFVLSLKAGGLGLNLTAANHVFHFDRWWNPAVENQATDRAYRIGQSRNVQVHKFICAGTLEERIDALIESKKALAESVVGGAAEGWLTELSSADLRDLVRLSADVVGD